jgi:hypothetical protein
LKKVNPVVPPLGISSPEIDNLQSLEEINPVTPLPLVVASPEIDNLQFLEEANPVTLPPLGISSPEIDNPQYLEEVNPVTLPPLGIASPEIDNPQSLEEVNPVRPLPIGIASPKPLINKLAERRTAPFDDPNKPRANISAVKSHISLILRKLIIIFSLILVAAIGLSSTVIGAIAHARKCYAPYQPSISIWLLVIGVTSFLLGILLILLVSYQLFFLLCSTGLIFYSDLYIYNMQIQVK